MSKKLASLKIKIDADGAQAIKELKSVEKKVKDIAQSMKKIGSAMTKYVTGPLVALAAVSIKTADTQLQAEAKLLNALKGREAAQKRLIAQASEIQGRSLFGDEEIINQQAILASMGRTEQQIRDIIEASVQLASATGMSLDSAVKNLAKTYGGLAGELGESIPALRSLTKEQLMNGDAVKYILNEYKGFAETAANVGAGSLVQLKNKFGDLTEQIGIILLPALNKLVDILSSIVDWLSGLSDETKTVIVAIAALTAAIGPALIVIGQMATGLSALTTGFVTLKAAITGLSASSSTIVAMFSTWATALASVFAYLFGVYKLFDDLANRATKANYTRNENAYKATYEKFSNPSVTDTMIAEALKTREQEIAKWEYKLKNKSARANGLAGTRAALARLYGERDALKAVTKARREANDEAQRAAETQSALADVANQAAAAGEAVKNAIGGLAGQVDEADGLIGQLQTRIKNLQELLPWAKSTEEIAKLNSEIANLQGELKKLQDLKLSKTNGPVSWLPIAIRKEQIGTAPSLTFDFDDNGVLKLDETWRLWRQFREALSQEATRAMELSKEISSILSTTANNFAMGIGEMFGNAVSGEQDAWLEGGRNLLRILGQSLKDLGSALIKYSGIVEAFKVAIKNVFKGPAGIAAAVALGIGAIAAGQALINKASQPPKLAKGGLAYGPTLAVVGDNPGATSDPEVIAPLSKLRRYMSGQRLELVGDISFELSGDKLRAALNRENIRLATLG